MENKDFIVENSIKLFSKKGYETVGVQEICEVSKITKPTLYYYFKSKAGLLQYIADTKGDELLKIIQNALTYNHDFIKGLTDVLKAEINFARENVSFFNLHCTLLNSPEDSEQKNIYASVINNIQNCFDDFFISSCNEFGNMKGKEKLYATLFHNNVVSTAVLISKEKMEYSEETIYQIIHSLVYGMAN